MEDVKKRADVKELILSVITRLSEDAQNEWKAVKWDDVKATCRRMGISHKVSYLSISQNHDCFSYLARVVSLESLRIEDAEFSAYFKSPARIPNLGNGKSLLAPHSRGGAAGGCQRPYQYLHAVSPTSYLCKQSLHSQWLLS